MGTQKLCSAMAGYLIYISDQHDDYGSRVCRDHLSAGITSMLAAEAPGTEVSVAALNAGAGFMCEYQPETSASIPQMGTNIPSWRIWLRRNIRRVSIHRRARGVPFEFEWHNYNNVRYLNISISSPAQHKWWATSIYIYTSLGRGPAILGWTPPYVYRYGWRK